MISWIMNAVSILRALIGLWNEFKRWQKEQAIKVIDKRASEREKAAEDLEKAETEDEFDKASDALHDRMRRP